MGRASSSGAGLQHQRAEIPTVLLWTFGLLMTWAFYVVLPHLPLNQEYAYRYFCSHWITYTTTGLFFVGMSLLGDKARQLPFEKGALRDRMFSEIPAGSGESLVESINQIEERLRPHLARWSGSHLAKRIASTLTFIRSKQSAEGIDGHLGYLAEVNAARLHDSYAAVRTITWAIPILGFLGTVIGITMAIANITPEQLESSLNDVTAGLAVAFDTTALSLGLSMVLVFTSFAIEKGEQGILDQVEDYGIQRLLPLFPALESTTTVMSTRLSSGELAMQDLVLEHSKRLLERHMLTWDLALNQMSEQFAEQNAQNLKQLEVSLNIGMQKSLEEQDHLLAGMRAEYLQSCQAFTQQMTLQMQQIEESRLRSAKEAVAREEAFWERLNQEWAERQMQAAQSWKLASHEFAGALVQWSGQLEKSQELVVNQIDELRHQQEGWLRLAEGTHALADAEVRLADNLEVIRVADTLETTLQNLSALVNLLSVRVKGKAA